VRPFRIARDPGAKEERCLDCDGRAQFGHRGPGAEQMMPEQRTTSVAEGRR
jgi:hypothetical protein